GERDRSVVRALDQRRFDQFTDGQALTLLQVDRRFADGRSLTADRDDVVQARVLKRDQDGHQLRDAGDRQTLPVVALSEYLPGDAVLDEIGARGHLRRARESRRREEQEDGREKRQPDLHGGQRSSYGTRNRSPGLSAVGSTPGFSRRRAPTLVPRCEAIAPSVSPLWITYQRFGLVGFGRRPTLAGRAFSTAGAVFAVEASERSTGRIASTIPV